MLTLQMGVPVFSQGKLYNISHVLMSFKQFSLHGGNPMATTRIEINFVSIIGFVSKILK